ncbi:MAG: tetratricopeptide repeat protein, partial [Rhodothermales bacterium]|nr:tetratricopeptide repeat protein [Rhodothermales bacterium]
MKVVVALFLLLFAAGDMRAQSAEELLQQALVLERSEGDYSGAITLYRQVADSPATDRLLVGQALVQMARAYENMGRSEAARTYQRVLSEFADVPALVSEAREGFARTRQAPSTPFVEPGRRDIIDTGDGFSLIGGGISPGGRYLFAPYYDPMGITYFDTSTGEQTIIPVERRSGHAEFVRFSPDESMFATAWRGYEPAGEELLLFDVATHDYEVLLDATAY